VGDGVGEGEVAVGVRVGWVAGVASSEGVTVGTGTGVFVGSGIGVGATTVSAICSGDELTSLMPCGTLIWGITEYVPGLRPSAFTSALTSDGLRLRSSSNVPETVKSNWLGDSTALKRGLRRGTL